MDNKTLAVVQKYSKSLVDVAIERDQKTANELYADIDAILEVFSTTDLAAYLESSAVAHDEKAKFLRLFQESSSVYLNNFLEVILQNEREALLLPILQDVVERLNDAANQYDVVVTTVQPLTAEQKTRIQQVVKNKFAIDTRQIVENIDESIIGGFIIQANNKVIDTSIKGQLRELKMNLK